MTVISGDHTAAWNAWIMYIIYIIYENIYALYTKLLYSVAATKPCISHCSSIFTSQRFTFFPAYFTGRIVWSPSNL
jgi:hypothetical protein